MIEAPCREWGKAYLRLDCGKTNHAPRAYYETNGFIAIGETTVKGESLTLYEKAV
jgi:hypothetical protein